jgi:hypothetical protein
MVPETFLRIDTLTNSETSYTFAVWNMALYSSILTEVDIQTYKSVGYAFAASTFASANIIFLFLGDSRMDTNNTIKTCEINSLFISQPFTFIYLS